MEYGRLPIKHAIKPIADFINDQEEYFATQHGGVVVHKATPAEIAKIEAELAAKAARSGLGYSITAEMGIKKKPERLPEIPFEEMAVKSRLAEVVKFERAVG